MLLLYRIVPDLRWKNLLLTAAGLVFCSFGRIGYVPLLLMAAGLNWAAGLLLQRETTTYRKAVLVASVAAAVLAPVLFWYSGYMPEGAGGRLSRALPSMGAMLPLGLSVFTLRGLSYVIDVYRDRACGTRSYGEVLLYMSFFPQLAVGPVVKYLDFAGQLNDRTCTAETVAAGIQRFIAGLGKTLLIGSAAGAVADGVFGSLGGGMDSRLAWLGVVCFALQIYFTFGGYSDMAIGMSRMFGFEVEENFNYPYGAESLRDFWSRWNISLCAWFEEYLYEPMCRGRGRVCKALSLPVVFVCMGIWHRAGLPGMVWGAAHGVLYILERGQVIPADRLGQSAAGRGLSRLFTLVCTVLLFVLLRVDSLQDAGTVYSALFAFRFNDSGRYALCHLVSGTTAAALALGMIMSVGTARKLSNFMLTTPMWVQDTYMICKRLGSLVVLVLCILCMAHMGVAYDYPFA